VAPSTLPADPGQRLEPPTSRNKNPHPATVGHRFLAELCARGGDPASYARWRRQVRAAGYCQRPVRLLGGVDHIDTQTGEAHTVFDSAGEPNGVLLKACGTRRAARCPPCAEVYRADAYQLLRAGLVGGKGVPQSISGHPRLFVTFTAPSFGPVHSSRVPYPLGGPPIRWGAQLDLRPIHPGLGEQSEGQVAGYLAKYATKATEGLGAALDARITSLAELERLEFPEHTGRLVRACWTLGGRRELAQLGLRR
jgi:hypothetical protein